jgi:hypothetical protein
MTQPDSKVLREKILAFVSSLKQPVLLDEGGSVLSLDGLGAADREGVSPDAPGDPSPGAVAGGVGLEVRLEVEFGKLLLEIWGAGRSLVRRVEGVELEGRRLLVQARKPGGWAPPVVLEIREASDTEPREPAFEGRDGAARDRAEPCRSLDRDEFERHLMAMLAREYPGSHFERVTHRSNRERSFSGCYTRGWARRGREAWAFLGLSELENPSAIENALVYGLIWLDWLRGRVESSREIAIVSGLKLVLPPAAVAVAAHRAAYLNPRAAGVEILEWTPVSERPRAIDLGDYGNVETRLTPRWRGARLIEAYRPLLRELLGPHEPRVRVTPDATGDALSLRVFGLEVARIEGRTEARVSFGLEGERTLLEDGGGRAAFHAFLANALRLRNPRSADRSHPLFRLQPERWLESLLIDDIRRVDPALMSEHVYPQVPAFSGPASPGFASAPFSRGVIDILGVTRDAETGVQRLAVVELKLDEDPNLPLQGLDYWLRVKWLEDRNQFRECGYFPGLVPSPAPPLIYLVCPAFRFHSTTETVLRYLHPSIRVVKVGVNQRWRDGVKVLFRRTLEQGKEQGGGARFEP